MKTDKSGFYFKWVELYHYVEPKAVLEHFVSMLIL